MPLNLSMLSHKFSKPGKAKTNIKKPTPAKPQTTQSPVSQKPAISTPPEIERVSSERIEGTYFNTGSYYNVQTPPRLKSPNPDTAKQTHRKHHQPDLDTDIKPTHKSKPHIEQVDISDESTYIISNITPKTQGS